MKRADRLLRVALFACLGLAACSDSTQPNAPVATDEASRPAMARKSRTPTDEYVLVAPDGAQLPASLEASVTAAGGTLVRKYEGAGVAVAKSTSPGFADKAAKISGVETVAQDEVIQWVEPDPTSESVDAEAIEIVASATGTAETFSALQWAPGAISAPQAWAAGYRGRGARVAVLYGGVHSTHIDLAPNLDIAHSTSFVPGQPFNTDVGTFWHGTHVAGIVAAAANDIGTAGIAPEATIIAVKVLHNGSGSFSQVIAGIIYAATPIAEGGAGAHVINMSLGAVFDRKEPGGMGLEKALSAATKYARQRGVLVIAATGNEAIDLDRSGQVISVPAQSSGVLGISATGPLGWGEDPSVSLDRVASYTNYGHRAVGLAAPGGDAALEGNAVCSRPRLPSGTVLQFCWVLDMVMSTTRGTGASIGSYGWAAGTSMAAPAAAGVAALIIGKYGPLGPAQLEARLRQSADDLGKPGEDDFYGQGRINAWRAVTQ